MHKILFLDIDGVLNSKPYLAARPEAAGCSPAGGDWSLRFQPELVARLQVFLDRSGAQIVLSSAWRNDPNVTRSAALFGVSQLDYVASLVRRSGAPRADFLSACIDGDRGPSIIAWVRAHAQIVSSWVAVDDAPVGYMGDAEHRTVRTDPEHGLRDVDVERAVSMLAETR